MYQHHRHHHHHHHDDGRVERGRLFTFFRSSRSSLPPPSCPFFFLFFSVTPPTLQDSCKLIFWSSAAPQRCHRAYMKQHPAPPFCPSTDAAAPAGAPWPPLHAVLSRAVRGPLSVRVELQRHKSPSWCWRCVSAVAMWRFRRGHVHLRLC